MKDKIILLKEKIFSNKFFASIAVLVGGTASAQLIGIIALPILTRIYTPEQFNIFAVFLSVLAVLSVSACLRFEVAIPIPDSDDEALNLSILSLISVTILCFILYLVVLFLPDDLFKNFFSESFLPYMPIIPLAIWFICLFGIFQYWCIRNKRFGLLAKNRISQMCVYVGSQLLLGVYGFLSFGLIAGNIISNAFAAINLAINNRKNIINKLKNISYGSLKKTFVNNNNYPKYSTFEAFANSAAIEIPVLIIAAISVGPLAGYLLLATRILGAPISLLGSAIGQVFLSQAPTELRNGTLAEFTSKTLYSLIKLGALPIVCFALLAPFVIPIVFGSEWGMAGEYIVLLAPWFFVQFLVSPISMVLNVTNNQKVALMLQLLGCAVRIGSLLIVANYSTDSLIEVYSISGYLFYLLYLLVVLKVLNVHGYEIFKFALCSIGVGFICLFSYVVM